MNVWRNQMLQEHYLIWTFGNYRIDLTRKLQEPVLLFDA